MKKPRKHKQGFMMRCINNSGAEDYLTVGRKYRCFGFSRGGYGFYPCFYDDSNEIAKGLDFERFEMVNPI